MQSIIEIITATFSKEDYNKESKEIFINLNHNRSLDQRMNETGLREGLYIKSETGHVKHFMFKEMDKWEMVLETKGGITARLGYK